MNKTLYDIVFIGAGASALMAASHLPTKKIALIDTNPKIGAKILISGGGKCNLTNRFLGPQHYLADEAFIQKALDLFPVSLWLSFVKNHHIALQEREHGQMFCARSAKDLVAMFHTLTSHCTFYLSTSVLRVRKNDSFEIETTQGKLCAKKVVIASGGLSYASLGASGIGYDIAQAFGHTIVSTAPALVGFTLQKEQFWMKELSGIAFQVAIFVGKKIFRENLLFAHKGISGPAVLSASLYWKKGAIVIDFLPHIEDLTRLFKEHKHKQITTAIGLPKRFMKGFLDSVGMEDKVLSKLSSHEQKTLLQLKAYSLSPAGNFGFSKAEATKGGIATDEVDARSFESKKQQGLYMIGEVLDVTGELGGFNLHWAFASGYALAKHLS